MGRRGEERCAVRRGVVRPGKNRVKQRSPRAETHSPGDEDRRKLPVEGPGRQFREGILTRGGGSRRNEEKRILCVDSKQPNRAMRGPGGPFSPPCSAKVQETEERVFRTGPDPGQHSARCEVADLSIRCSGSPERGGIGFSRGLRFRTKVRPWRQDEGEAKTEFRFVDPRHSATEEGQVRHLLVVRQSHLT